MIITSDEYHTHPKRHGEPMNTEIATINASAFLPRSFDELDRLAGMLANTSMVPVAYKGKAGDCAAAIMMGAELGVSPMQALQGIAVINGRPSVWGDLLKAICSAHPSFEDCVETIAGEGDSMAATCVAKRKGRTDVEVTFSVADAKKAGLWNKGGPWSQYPKRMLQMRARGFALRDQFPEVLKGIACAEESADMDAPAPAPTKNYTAAIDPAPAIAQEPEAPKELPPYPDSRFDARLPKVREAIENGTPAQKIIDSLSEKYLLSPGQIGLLHTIEAELCKWPTSQQAGEVITGEVIENA